MTQLASFTIAGQADIRQRLNADGLAALGLAGPLLSPAWTATVPDISTSTLDFTPSAEWYAPISGMLVGVPDGKVPGLSLLDGKPAANGGSGAAVLMVHPQARLRLERLIVGALQSGSATPPDASLRPVPSTILIRNATKLPETPLYLAPGDKTMPAGQVTFHDERGLIIDPFAFAAALDALIKNNTPLGIVTPSGSPVGTLEAIAGLADKGKYFYVVDLHGRPWSDPGPGKGIGLFTGSPPTPTDGGHVTGGSLMQWTDGAVLAAEADPGDTDRPRKEGTVRFWWSTFGTLDTVPLQWPAAGAATLVRDTLRVAATDLTFHLLGNRTASRRDGVDGADDKSVKEQAPQVRDGSPVSLLADGRAALGWFGQVILQTIQGKNPDAPIKSGPLLAATVAFDADQNWPFPTDPTAAGRWPQNPPAVAVSGSRSNVLQQVQILRTAATAQWIKGSNDVLVTLPGTLPDGLYVRLYPIKVLLGVGPGEQPILVRHDGGGTFVQNGGKVLLPDPFQIGKASRPSTAALRADAAVTYVPSDRTGLPPQTLLLGNLQLPVSAEVDRPPALQPNFLNINFWKGTASAPILGAPSRGSFDLTKLVQDVVRQLATDANPREAPRLPTMARTESLLAVQLQDGPADPFRGVLTGAWLGREADTHTYKSANPGGVSNKEVHAPGVAGSGQLGFDLWVAALHRCRPVFPLTDLTGIPNLPALPTNWVLLQTGASSNPPNPPSPYQSTCAAVLQTVSPFVESPELGAVPEDDVDKVVNWINRTLGSTTIGSAGTPNITGNDPELRRQLVREVRTSKYGRRDAQWALRRALRHARELVYIETPLLAHSSHLEGAPTDGSAVDVVTELQAALSGQPGLRVVILLPRDLPFPSPHFDPWAMYFYGERLLVAQTLRTTGGTINGRPRVVIAHPMGIPGRPLVIRTTTVIVDDVWCLVGTSTLSRRGLTFDGATDVVMTDRTLDRGAGVAIRAYRKALMAGHLGVGANQPIPPAQYAQLHQPAAAHSVFADVLANGGEGKLLPLWPGPDPNAPGATKAHPAGVADPDGRGGASLITTIAGALAGDMNV